jgi:hypothetical protein
MKGYLMGMLAIALWAIALTGGVFFPPLFIAPMYCTWLWLKQRQARKLNKS